MVLAAGGSSSEHLGVLSCLQRGEERRRDMVERLNTVLPSARGRLRDHRGERRKCRSHGLPSADELAASDAPRPRRPPRGRIGGTAVRSSRGSVRHGKTYVFFTDGDGQFDVAEIERLLPFVPEYDVVVGYRLTRAEGGLRSLNATCWNWLVRRLFRHSGARRRLRLQALQARGGRAGASRGRRAR